LKILHPDYPALIETPVNYTGPEKQNGRLKPNYLRQEQWFTVPSSKKAKVRIKLKSPRSGHEAGSADGNQEPLIMPKNPLRIASL
jgi:hypothetical protein